MEEMRKNNNILLLSILSFRFFHTRKFNQQKWLNVDINSNGVVCLILKSSRENIYICNIYEVFKNPEKIISKLSKLQQSEINLQIYVTAYLTML